MTTIKSHTDLEQSKKLAEILSYDTADQIWVDVPNSTTEYRHEGDIPYLYYSGIGIPCWSLAALLAVLPNLIGDCFKTISCLYGWHCAYMNSNDEIMNNDTKAENPIDACYEMILKLHEQNLL